MYAAWRSALCCDHYSCNVVASNRGSLRRSALSRSTRARDFLGVAIRTAWAPGPLWRPGIGFSAKYVLEFAIVMLGASVSVATIIALGPFLIIGIASIVAIAIGSSYAICRVLGLPLRMAVLIACGNSICGNSAIAAVAPVIGADSDDVASSISFTAVLGVVVVLVLPLLVPILQLSLTQYGVLAGLTVYAVASPRGDAADRSIEQPGRNSHQARACAHARAGGARIFAIRPWTAALGPYLAQWPLAASG